MVGKPLTRRRFLSIAASTAVCSASIGLPFPVRASGLLQTWDGYVMGARAQITLAGLSKHQFKDLLHACLAEIRRLEAIFSLYDPNSSISRLNRAGRLDVPPPELLECLAVAGHIHGQTEGMFDVTVQPLWSVYTRYRGRPPADELVEALSRVSFERLEIGQDAIAFREAGMEITLNGIAQGFVTDKVTDLMRQWNLTNVLVNMGEHRALGGHPSGRPWVLGLNSPAEPGRTYDTVGLMNRAVATSGGYGTPFEDGSNHLLDPRTGKSFSHFQTLSVIAPTATMADGLSTGLSGLEFGKIKAIIGKNPDLQVLALTGEGKAVKL